jgi:hypothetical protein
MIGGSNKSVVLYTKDGVKLGNVGDQDSWIWCCAARPGNYLGIGIILGKGTRFFLEKLISMSNVLAVIYIIGYDAQREQT